MDVPLFEEEDPELSSALLLDCSIPCHSQPSPSALFTALSGDTIYARGLTPSAQALPAWSVTQPLDLTVFC